MGSNKKRPLHRYTLNGEPERENERRRSIGRDWINLSICQLHGWVCLVAAVRLRLSLRLRRVHRSQVDRRVYTRVCVRLRENPREPRLYTRPSIYLSIYLAAARTSKCAWRNAFACVDARSRVCASERNRAYVTAWLGAQIQRAQLAHRTSRRIVLILPLHSRGAEEATSLATTSSQPAVFVLRPGRDKGFAGFSGMIGAISGWRGLIGFLLTDFEWNLARNFSFFFFLFLVESVEATFFDFGNVRSN